MDSQDLKDLSIKSEQTFADFKKLYGRIYEKLVRYSKDNVLKDKKTLETVVETMFTILAKQLSITKALNAQKPEPVRTEHPGGNCIDTLSGKKNQGNKKKLSADKFKLFSGPTDIDHGLDNLAKMMQPKMPKIRKNLKLTLQRNWKLIKAK